MPSFVPGRELGAGCCAKTGIQRMPAIESAERMAYLPPGSKSYSNWRREWGAMSGGHNSDVALAPVFEQSVIFRHQVQSEDASCRDQYAIGRVAVEPAGQTAAFDCHLRG